MNRSRDCAHDDAHREPRTKPTSLEDVKTLGREVYGADFERFLVTPRRSLGGETPRALIERGEFERVREVLVRMAEGNFG